MLGWSVQEGIEKLPEAPVWLIEQAPGRQSDKAGSSERAKCVAQVRTETAGAADQHLELNMVDGRSQHWQMFQTQQGNRQFRSVRRGRAHWKGA